MMVTVTYNGFNPVVGLELGFPQIGFVGRGGRCHGVVWGMYGSNCGVYVYINMLASKGYKNGGDEISTRQKKKISRRWINFGRNE